jgi:DNA-binding IclR family transcriptional regulator
MIIFQLSALYLSLNQALLEKICLAAGYGRIHFSQAYTNMATEDGKKSIQVIGRMMNLLHALAAARDATSLKSLAAATGLHPSTAHRILAVMVENRLAERVDAGSYRLGIHLLELGNVVKSRLNVRHEALPFMRALQQEIGETINLSVRQNDEIVYVERAIGNRGMMRIVQVDGSRAPLHITSIGKIFLAEDGVDKAREYAKRTGLPKYTRNTFTDSTKFLKELETVKQQGFAYDNEEAENGVACIGAGIRNDEGLLIAGISVSAPADRLSKAWADKIKNTAEEIGKTLGYRKNN